MEEQPFLEIRRAILEAETNANHGCGIISVIRA